MSLSKLSVILFIRVLLFTLALGLPTSALADKIEFGDGNILQGTAASLSKGALVFATEYAKKIKIPVEKIQKIETEKTVTLKLTNDSVLKGRLTTLDDGRFAVILEPSGETVPFEWSQVKSLNDPPGTWDGNFALGGNIQTGNVERSNISLSFDAKRDWEHDRFQFRFLHNYAEDSGSITSRNSFGAMKFDHFFTKNFFSALSLEMLKDEFKDLNLRAIIGFGLGYRFWNDDVKNLEIEAGFTYFSEDLDVGQDDQFMSGRVGITYSYKIFDNLQFKDYMLYYPSFDEPKEYRLRNEASLISQIGGGWSFKLSHIFDQNSDPAPGVEDKDQQFIFAIQYSF